MLSHAPFAAVNHAKQWCRVNRPQMKEHYIKVDEAVRHTIEVCPVGHDGCFAS